MIKAQQHFQRLITTLHFNIYVESKTTPNPNYLKFIP